MIQNINYFVKEFLYAFEIINDEKLQSMFHSFFFFLNEKVPYR